MVHSVCYHKGENNATSTESIRAGHRHTAQNILLRAGFCERAGSQKVETAAPCILGVDGESTQGTALLRGGMEVCEEYPEGLACPA